MTAATARIALCTLALVACTQAQAQIYKCPDASGRTVIQQLPCQDGQELDVRPASGASAPKSNLSKAIDELHQARMAEIKQINERCDALGVTRLSLGMDKDDALCVPGWRYPDKTNTTVSANGVREQVVYTGPDGRAARKYLYFENGRLSAVQQ